MTVDERIAWVVKHAGRVVLTTGITNRAGHKSGRIVAYACDTGNVVVEDRSLDLIGKRLDGFYNWLLDDARNGYVYSVEQLVLDDTYKLKADEIRRLEGVSATYERLGDKAGVERIAAMIEDLELSREPYVSRAWEV